MLGRQREGDGSNATHIRILWEYALAFQQRVALRIRTVQQLSLGGNCLPPSGSRQCLHLEPLWPQAALRTQTPPQQPRCKKGNCPPPPQPLAPLVARAHRRHRHCCRCRCHCCCCCCCCCCCLKPAPRLLQREQCKWLSWYCLVHPRCSIPNQANQDRPALPWQR